MNKATWAGAKHGKARLEISGIYDVRIIKTEMLPHGIPDRVLIIGSRVLENISSIEYIVQYESTGQIGTILEGKLISVLSSRHTKARVAPVFTSPQTINREEAGWRWVGNFEHTVAMDVAKEVKYSKNIKRARVCEAYDRNGKLIDQSSVWIMYNKPLKSDAVNAREDGTFEIEI